MKNVRASLRFLGGLGILAGFVVLAPIHAFIIKPIAKKNNFVPSLFYNSIKKLLGYKIEFNKSSTPIDKTKQTWFIANHLSMADFIPLGSKLNATFIGKGEILKWPVVGALAKSANYIGLRRSRQHNPESRAKIITNFNEGSNAIMFPEGTTTKGGEVSMFRAALLKTLFGETGLDKKEAEVSLKKDIFVQPVAIKVKSINGQENAHMDDNLRDMYAMYDEHNHLKRVWKRMQIKETVLELTTLPILNPKDFNTAEDLANHAAQQVADVINPGQTEFKPARIPGQKQSSKKVAMK